MMCRNRGAGPVIFEVVVLFSFSLAVVEAGAAANVLAEPASVEFNRVRNITASGAVNVVLTNSGPSGDHATSVTCTFQGGAGPFVITGEDTQINGGSQQNFDITCEPAVPGDFSIQGVTTLSSGHSASISVAFAPTQRGARACTMTVIDDVAAVPNNTLAMTGFGQAGELSIVGAPGQRDCQYRPPSLR